MSAFTILIIYGAQNTKFVFFNDYFIISVCLTILSNCHHSHQLCDWASFRLQSVKLNVTRLKGFELQNLKSVNDVKVQTFATILASSNNSHRETGTILGFSQTTFDMQNSFTVKFPGRFISSTLN